MSVNRLLSTCIRNVMHMCMHMHMYMCMYMFGMHMSMYMSMYMYMCMWDFHVLVAMQHLFLGSAHGKNNQETGRSDCVQI